MSPKTFIFGMCLSVLAACSQEEVTDLSAEPATAVFDISTRGNNTTVQPDATTQQVRLYVGEHRPEHLDDKNHLHLRQAYNLETGASFHLDNLPPRRYKLAFICVPANLQGIFSEEKPGENSCDFNQQLIDYGTVLTAQQNPDYATGGHLYRKVINRWLKSGETLTEDVTLNRLNGQLIIDMGIPEDQFEHKVTEVEVIIEQTPTLIRIADNDKDELIMSAPTNKAFTYTSVPEWGVRKPHRIILNLLPSELKGKIVVTTGSNLKTYSLQGVYGGGTVLIKQNTRTTLEFNGLHKDCFTVKYAGFENSQIGVDDDEWDGWQEQ